MCLLHSSDTLTDVSSMVDDHDAFPRSKSEERVLDHYDDFNNEEDFGDFKLPDLSVSTLIREHYDHIKICGHWLMG